MLREIIKEGDEVLRKKCHRVEKFDEKLHALLDDMYETMQEANGVGLAAPQVGILRRIAVVDVGDGKIELVNPEIIKESGEQTGDEGCLSFPGKWGEVTRPMKVTVKAQDRYGKEFKIKGTELLARAFCHEIDHLDGQLYIDVETKEITADEILAERNGKDD